MNNEINIDKTDFSVMPTSEAIALSIAALLLGFTSTAFTLELSDIGQKVIAVCVTLASGIILQTFVNLKRRSTARIIKAIENMKKT